MFQQYLHKCTEKVIRYIDPRIIQSIDMKSYVFPQNRMLLPSWDF